MGRGERGLALGLLVLAGLAWGVPAALRAVGGRPAPGGVPEPAPGRRLAGWEALLLGRPLDLNRATREDLEALPGVGPATARRILELRTRKGRLTSVEELLEVRGIGPRTLSRLRPYVTIREFGRREIPHEGAPGLEGGGRAP